MNLKTGLQKLRKLATRIKADKPVWKIEELHRQCHTVTFNMQQSPSDFWALICSDAHLDNKLCDRELLKKHHQLAQERNAPIFHFGDLFCAMQGKWDKRADLNELRPEHQSGNYLDRLVDTSAEWFEPFKSDLALITLGNHETSIIKHHQTHLTERLCDRLKVKMGGYWGYVLFRFAYQNAFITKKLCYHHGYGGGGEVTRGYIDNNRTRSQYNGDIFCSGHIHRHNQDKNVMWDITAKGTIFEREQYFLRSSTYKGNGSNHDAETGKGPRPRGGWWLHFHCMKTVRELVVTTTPIMAQ